MTSAKHNQTRVSSDRAGSMIYEDSLSKGKDHDALVRATFLASKNPRLAEPPVAILHVEMIVDDVIFDMSVRATRLLIVWS